MGTYMDESRDDRSLWTEEAGLLGTVLALCSPSGGCFGGDKSLCSTGTSRPSIVL